MPDLEQAARAIAEQYPIEAYGHMEERSCRHCGRDVEDYMRNVPTFDHRHRQVHEPECPWIALRDALGMSVEVGENPSQVDEAQVPSTSNEEGA